MDLGFKLIFNGMKKGFLIAAFCIAACAFSQELTYKTGGRIYNSDGQKMKPSEVRELLKNQPGMLQFYNEGRGNKTFGNILFYSSFGLFAADFLSAAGSYKGEKTYPGAMTFVGIGTFIISFPIKAGYTKKIKTVVTDYNQELKNKDNGLSIESIDFVANQNGAGIKISF